MKGGNEAETESTAQYGNSLKFGNSVNYESFDSTVHVHYCPK